MAFLENGRKLLLAEVGHSSMKEVDLIEAGKNFGRSIKEGHQTY
jgi:hypothetical protein